MPEIAEIVALPVVVVLVPCGLQVYFFSWLIGHDIGQKMRELFAKIRQFFND